MARSLTIRRRVGDATGGRAVLVAAAAFVAVLAAPDRAAAGPPPTLHELIIAEAASCGEAAESRDRFREIAVTAAFGCGRRADDTVRCWGNSGKDGRLPPPAARFVSLDAGSAGNICGVRDDKHIVCWGAHTDGVYGMDFE